MEPEKIFVNLEGDLEPVQIESFCVNCEQNGMTTILLTKIPFFKEIIVAAFSCDNCGYRNNEIQFGGALAESGKKLTLKVEKPDDLSRSIVKSEFASISIPDLQLDIPVNKKGSVNTIEGILTNVKEDLEQDQPLRKDMQPEVHQKIEEFIKSLEQFAKGEKLPFLFVIDDPSGNSHISNPYVPAVDPNLKVESYTRTIEQLVAMGYSPENEDLNNQSVEAEKAKKVEEETKAREVFESFKSTVGSKGPGPAKSNYSEKEIKEMFSEIEKRKQKEKENIVGGGNMGQVDLNQGLGTEGLDKLKEDSLSFPMPCHNCFREGETRMCNYSIPHFKEVILMSFICEHCGAHSAETKTGGGISEKGQKLVLKINSTDDLQRDVFKSETSTIEIPEIDFKTSIGTLGGIFTTVEGVIDKLLENLRDNNPFIGDSDGELTGKMFAFLAKLEKLKEKKWTLILDDPLGNSFISGPNGSNEKGENLEQIEYTRTAEQEDELGILDMKTENY